MLPATQVRLHKKKKEKKPPEQNKLQNKKQNFSLLCAPIKFRHALVTPVIRSGILNIIFSTGVHRSQSSQSTDRARKKGATTVHNIILIFHNKHNKPNNAKGLAKKQKTKERRRKERQLLLSWTRLFTPMELWYDFFPCFFCFLCFSLWFLCSSSCFLFLLSLSLSLLFFTCFSRVKWRFDKKLLGRCHIFGSCLLTYFYFQKRKHEAEPDPTIKHLSTDAVIQMEDEFAAHTCVTCYLTLFYLISFSWIVSACNLLFYLFLPISFFVI